MSPCLQLDAVKYARGNITPVVLCNVTAELFLWKLFRIYLHAELVLLRLLVYSLVMCRCGCFEAFSLECGLHTDYGLQK